MSFVSALVNQTQLPYIIDILIRRDRHHVIINGSDSEKINLALSEALIQHLTEPNIPKSIRNAELIYLDIEKVELDLISLREKIREEKKCLILALNNIAPLLPENANTGLGKFIRSILADNSWRIIVFSQERILDRSFASVQLNKITETEILNILKNYCIELENYHEVIIPDETISSALSMTTHYLPAKSTIDAASELLDSSAARASNIDEKKETQKKPVVTTDFLARAVASRTQIPVSHLRSNRFQATQIASSLQQQIHGQETAINLISSILQQACTKLHKKTGALTSFLFVGGDGSGKTETALALAEHLFGHSNALLHIKTNQLQQSYKIIKKAVLQKIDETPYSIFLVENIDRASPDIISFFNNIITQDNFQNAIIIMTTSLGSGKVSNLMQPQQKQEVSSAAELMHLVLNKNLDEPASHVQMHISAEELCEIIMPDLENYFSKELLSKLNIVPFVPLDYAALDKIIRHKISSFKNQIETNLKMELSYTSDVIKFILHEAVQIKSSLKSIDKLLEHFLYSCVAHEIIARNENKHKGKQLFVRMNDDGQSLRCETIQTNERALSF